MSLSSLLARIFGRKSSKSRTTSRTAPASPVSQAIRKRGGWRSWLGIEQLESRELLSATLLADKPDYAPGTPAQLTASGFLAGETVQFQVVHADGKPDIDAGHAPFLVTD